MNPLDSYLVRVARELRSMPAAKRDDELRELRSHLEQRAEDFVRDGLSHEAAQAQTLQEFGSPRALGIKLCDVWEAGPFSTKQLFLAIGRVTLLWFCATVELLAAIYAQIFWPQSVLFPELPYLVAIVALCVPLSCGWIWYDCLGRRRQLTALLFFVVLFDLLFFGGCLSHLNNRPFPTDEPIYNLIFALNPLLAVAGTYLAHARNRRSQLALTSGQVISTIVSRSTHWNTKLIPLCAALVLGAGLWRHVSVTLHPPDPISALRTSLLVNHNPQSMGNFPIDPPIILGLHELPATTPAETDGREKRVWFRVEAHANEDYLQANIDYLKSQLVSADTHTEQGKHRIRQSLANLQHNSHIVEGVARLVQTPDGWQMEAGSFDRSQLWAWFYIARSPDPGDRSIPR